MISSSLLALNVANISSFYTLALFICHLFIDGNFRYGHILYDSQVFDGQFTTKIDSICSVKVPWLTTDINQPSPLPWHASERTDHILQLIFFHPDSLEEQIHKFKENFTFYRIFILCSAIDEMEMKKYISVIRNLNPSFDSNSLILSYDPRKEVVYIHWTLKNGNGLESVEKMIVERDREPSAEYKHLFDQTFGKYDRMQTTVIRAPGTVREKGGHKTFISFRQLFFANYFLSTLNDSYINMTLIPLSDIISPWKTQAVTQKQGKHHKDILLEYEPISEKKL